MTRSNGEGTLAPQDLGIGSLFENVRDAVIVAEAHTGRIVLWNPAATETFGYSSSEALELNVEALVPGRLKERHRTGLARYRDTGHGPYIDSYTLLELPAVRKGGEEISIEMTLSPVEPVAEGLAEERFALAIIRDVTERRRAEQALRRNVTERERAEEEVRQLNAELENQVAERTARLENALAELEERERGLRESKERYQAVVEQSAEGIFLFDAETKEVLDTNAAFRRMFGYTSEEVAHLRVYDLIPHDPESVDQNVERALEQRHILVGERSYRCKDGSAIDVEVSGGVISYRGKEVVCSIIRDITERKRAERALQEVKEAERNRMARDLHDGALQDIIYAQAEAEVVRVLTEDPELVSRLNRMSDALQRGGRELRGAVLDLRLGEEQDRPFSRQLESLVDQTRKMAPELDIHLETEGDLPTVPFGQTGTELLRALQEALTNVRRHAQARSVRVTVSVEDGALVAEVSDDGRGFEPGIASGVGFRSMRERMIALGGELEVESQPGDGTRVCFRVPVSTLREE